MRLTLSVLLTALVLAGCVRKAPPPPPAEVIDPRQLVVLTTQPPGALVALVEPLGYALVRIDRLEALGETLIDLRIPEGRTIPEAIAEVEALAPEVTAGANHAYRVQAVAGGQPGFANAMIGWPEQGCAAGRPVGMIDSGVTPDHPGLASGRIVQRSFHGSDAPPVQNHGTLMAELLIGAGRLTGARLFSANVASPDRADGDLAGVDAILRATSWLKGQGVGLINVSLAGPFNKLLNRAFGKAAEDGVVFVAAAGNLGPDAPPQFPAAFPFVIAVTAIDSNADIYRLAVRGAHIDLAAPGVDIVVPSGGGLRVLSGTSAAAPYVTAAIAADPTMAGLGSVAAIKRRLAARVQDLGPEGRDDTFGAGLVLAPAACAPPIAAGSS